MNASLPRWADLLLLPLVSLMVALAVAGGVVALVGQDPLLVIEVLIQGAFGAPRRGGGVRGRVASVARTSSGVT